jgi:hypothetical protein
MLPAFPMRIFLISFSGLDTSFLSKTGDGSKDGLGGKEAIVGKDWGMVNHEILEIDEKEPGRLDSVGIESDSAGLG